MKLRVGDPLLDFVLPAINGAAPVLLVDSLIDSELAGRLINEHQSDNFMSGMTRGVSSNYTVTMWARKSGIGASRFPLT